MTAETSRTSWVAPFRFMRVHGESPCISHLAADPNRTGRERGKSFM
jgi:hypothetical protein